jgi:Tfp pilus assembly protein PilO
LEKDLDVAFNETQEKVNQVIAQLPTDTETPLLIKSQQERYLQCGLHYG